MSDTPRTDYACEDDFHGVAPSSAELADLSRQLERELNQWRDCATKLYQAATAQQKTAAVELFCKLNKE